MLKELVTYLVSNLVQYPEDVSITITNDDGRKNVAITVRDVDRGKVIGKNGQTIKALRLLINTQTTPDDRIAIDIAQ